MNRASRFSTPFCHHSLPDITAFVKVLRVKNLSVVPRRVAIIMSMMTTALPFATARAQRVLTVISSDTGLIASPTIPAGLTTFRLLIKGNVRRELVVHRIPAGTMPEDLVKGAAGRPERWFEHWSFGGPAVPRDSSKEASVSVDLRPGRYALVAYEVDSAGRPRGDRYVWRDVASIAAAVLIPSRFPVPEATIRVKDSGIQVSGLLKPGSRILQVENVGGLPHELVIGRLRPGKTVDDVRRWDRDRNDLAPFVYVGGITPMSSEMTAQTKLVLRTGMHVVLCPMRHTGSRERDYRRGVIASFKVN